ncbi:MAG: DUF4290 domain-containing protein [Saprospiraceae bacterium]|nr:DUF4290 domain-containing protein [Saprospiraceae bacterium]
MNNLNIEYNTEKPQINFPEYGRSIQEMIQHATTIESKPLRQKTAEAIVGLMITLSPNNPNRNMDDFREKLWNHIFAISNYQLDVTPPPGIVIVKLEDKAKPAPLGYPNSSNRMRHYGNSVHALIQKAIEMPEGSKREGFVEVIASYMKLAYKTWNKEHYVSDDIVKEDLEILSNGQLSLHEGHDSLDKLAAGAGRLDKERNRQRNRNSGGGKNNNRNKRNNNRNTGNGGSGGGNYNKRRKR